MKVFPSLLFPVFLGISAFVSAAEPEINLTDELTAKEKQDIRVPTPGLFDGVSKITIDFSTFSDSSWCYPMRNGRVISPYGGARKRHAGMDIKTKAGDTIYAAFSGLVRFAKSYSGYGNVMVVRHAFGLETVYSHNSRHLVKVGEMVHVGQPIAIVGRTGRATTEHCHFEVRINGQHFNPSKIFDPQQHCLRRVKLVAYKSGQIEVTKVTDFVPQK